MNKKRYPDPLYVRVSEKNLERIDDLVEHAGVCTRAEMVRLLIEQGLKVIERSLGVRPSTRRPALPRRSRAREADPKH